MSSAWLLGHGSVLERAAARCKEAEIAVRCYEVLDAQSCAFFSLLNACNQVAFGGLGMPAWVQLDCCTLPGLMVGWGGAPEGISPDLRDRVDRQLGSPSTCDFWPYSEFCGVARGGEELVGVSTFSLVPRQGLALRAKALGLWLSGARGQIGATQWGNPATALHCRFGPLQLLRARMENHSRPEETFVYRLTPPNEQTLLAMALGTLKEAPAQVHSGEVQSEALGPELSQRMQSILDRGQALQIEGWSPREIRYRLRS